MQRTISNWAISTRFNLLLINTVRQVRHGAKKKKKCNQANPWVSGSCIQRFPSNALLCFLLYSRHICFLPLFSDVLCSFKFSCSSFLASLLHHSPSRLFLPNVVPPSKSVSPVRCSHTLSCLFLS